MSEGNSFSEVEINQSYYLEEKKIQSNFIKTEKAIDFLKKPNNTRPNYSLELACLEKPLMHYTACSNLFQILNFGIQSRNFKNRLSEYREKDPQLDMIAKQISSFRPKEKANYQAKDAICLSAWDEKMYDAGRGMLLLINPNIKIWGLEEQRINTGYGHGIKLQKINEDYELGNEKAYRDEVLACNIIPPSEIRTIVVTKHANILRDINSAVFDNVTEFFRAKKNNIHKANEDLLANIRLLANLNNDQEVQKKTDDLEQTLPTLDRDSISRQIMSLQKYCLEKFVDGKELNDTTFREAVFQKFNIKIIEI